MIIITNLKRLFITCHSWVKTYWAVMMSQTVLHLTQYELKIIYARILYAVFS